MLVLLYSIMYMTLRLTPEFCGEPVMAHPRFVVEPIIEYLSKYGEMLGFGWCRETTNKFGEPTHPHFHMNFSADLDEQLNKQSFQSWFRRHPCMPKGNKCYSVSILADPDDEDLWWRYLLKEQEKFAWSTHQPMQNMGREYNFPADFAEKIETHWAMAVDQRRLQVKRNIESRERALQNDSFRLRCYNHVHNLDPDTESGSTRWIFCQIVKYYMDNNKVPPFNTLLNMVYDYKVHFGIMTADQYYSVRYSDEI